MFSFFAFSRRQRAISYATEDFRIPATTAIYLLVRGLFALRLSPRRPYRIVHPKKVCAPPPPPTARLNANSFARSGRVQQSVRGGRSGDLYRLFPGAPPTHRVVMSYRAGSRCWRRRRKKTSGKKHRQKKKHPENRPNGVPPLSVTLRGGEKHDFGSR